MTLHLCRNLEGTDALLASFRYLEITAHPLVIFSLKTLQSAKSFATAICHSKGQLGRCRFEGKCSFNKDFYGYSRVYFHAHLSNNTHVGRRPALVSKQPVLVGCRGRHVVPGTDLI